MNISLGTRLSNDRPKIDWLICHISEDKLLCAYYDLNRREKDKQRNKNYRKPSVRTVASMAELIEEKSLKAQRYNYPTIISASDDWIVNGLNRPNWLKKRDDNYKEIISLTHPELIEKYLYGIGISEEINNLIPASRFNHKDQFYRIINRYIFFLCVKNGLLPFNLAKCGSNYQMAEDENDNPIKLGPKGSAQRKIRSKTRAVTQQDLKNIKKVVAFIKKNHKNVTISFAYRLFVRNFLSHLVERGEGHEKQVLPIVYEEERRISYDQFRYHFNQIYSRADLLRIRDGELAFKKDHEDRQGRAHDGVMFASQRYEVDATVLDMYVRYPYDSSARYTMGRPVLYVVVDVFSTMVVGMYLGFDGPNWQGVSMALANACLGKPEFAARYGLNITDKEWPAKFVPLEITIDNGNEYPNDLIRSVLKSEIGVSTFNLAAVFRGDAKGIVERKFGVLNETIHFQPGSMPQAPRRDEQHPSNQSELDYDDVMKLIIGEIIHHNQTANRANRCNFFSIANNTGISPQAIFESSLKEFPNNMRQTSSDDEAKVRWAFMPEHKAKVRSDCVYFNGVEYHHPYLKDAGLYSKARHHGHFTIIVKPVRDWVNHIWHKTDEGNYIKLEIKNINNANPLVSQHWEPVLHVLEHLKDKAHENDNNAVISRAYWDSVAEDNRQEKAELLQAAEPNRNKSIQTGIKDRKGIQKAIQTLEQVANVDETFSTSIAAAGTEYIDEYDDELYGD